MSDLNPVPGVDVPTPASPLARRVTDATRVPMALPTAKLAVPHVPGYYLYWHLGTDVRAALAAGYTHVDEEDIDIEQRGVANSAMDSGSTDMGTRISIVAGGTVSDRDPEPARLYLMKLPMEWHTQDMKAKDAANEVIAASIRSGSVGSAGDPDSNRKYMKSGQDLFYPKAPKTPT